MITSAKQATEIATEFLNEYFTAQKPISTKKGNGNWVVKVDVGLFLTQIATVEIDADSGEVLSYVLPQ